ncbi:hypothetical protein VTK73DRAFT_9440 [Phialemonium thermophilum]|uniref:Uncharacterized protein n=1 Tax=Phialemonium thermophilum TaxID=223376 RepID=A0ABR3XKU8_9PEZI
MEVGQGVYKAEPVSSSWSRYIEEYCAGESLGLRVLSSPPAKPAALGRSTLPQLVCTNNVHGSSLSHPVIFDDCPVLSNIRLVSKFLVFQFLLKSWLITEQKQLRVQQRGGRCLRQHTRLLRCEILLILEPACPTSNPVLSLYALQKLRTLQSGQVPTSHW